MQRKRRAQEQASSSSLTALHKRRLHPERVYADVTQWNRVPEKSACNTDPLRTASSGLDTDDDEEEAPLEVIGSAPKEYAARCQHLSTIQMELVNRTLLDPPKWICGDCGTTESVWCCLACGRISCGRYQQRHAKAHHAASRHPVALEINHRLVYCYVCDRYVANDTRRGELAALRRRLEELCTGIVEESRTRSGLLVRGSTQILALRPQRPDLHRADRRFTALQHWRLSVLARAFNTWRCVAARAELAAGSVSISSRCGVLAASGGGGLRLSFAEAPGQLLTPGQTGLRNLGNTCFMNSVLQALSCLAPFREYFLSVLVPRNSLWRQQTADCFSAAARKRLGEAPLSLSRELHNVLRVMWSGKYAVVTPVALLYTVWQKLPRFRGYQQQDAQEFLCFFRDTIHAELQQPQQPEFSATAAAGEAQPTPAPSPSSMTRRTVVQEMFEGQLESAVECLACGGVSQRSEPFLDLQLDVPSELLHVPRAGSRSRAPPPPRGHLHRLLEASLLCAETIDGYQCERCARPQKARRTLRISLV